MNDKKFWVSKLGIEILIGVFIAMLCGIAVSTGLFFIETKIPFNNIADKSYIEKATTEKVEKFRKFVDENNISKQDRKKINTWVKKQRDVMIHIYDSDKVIYDSTVFDENMSDNERKFDKENFYKKLYKVEFTDGTVYVDVFCFVDMKIHMFIGYCRMLIGFVVFVIVLLFLVKRRTVYIYKLRYEINILEGGNLDYPITIEGRDELSDLAKSVDDMRLAMIERQEQEDKQRNSTSKLVTAMSHDLRTPLTVLIGLLEILENKKYENTAQLEEYIHKSRDKAYQIKSLSDKIFKYFLAFSADKENLNMSRYDMQVIHELIGEYIFSLEDKNFKVEFSDTDKNGVFYADIEYIHRVFDNIFSNIIKYADNEKDVVIKVRLDESFIYIEFLNTVKTDSGKTESTNIGLETCRNIMSLHNGDFDSITDNGIFKVCIRLPLIDY